MENVMCDATVTQWVPRGFTYREHTLKCGSTGFDGWQVLCDKCSETQQPIAPWEGDDAGDDDDY